MKAECFNLLCCESHIFVRTSRFWRLGSSNIEYTKMKCFCKTSMKEWYKNWFVAPIEMKNDKEKYFSEEKTKDTILGASAILDYELMGAFLLQLYIKKYINKLNRRFKKINNFTKFKLN